MKAIKDNKIYKVDDTSKASYLAQGYDICDDDGNVLERSKKATVKYEEYAQVVAELEKSKAKNRNTNKNRNSDNKSDEKEPETEQVLSEE